MKRLLPDPLLPLVRRLKQCLQCGLSSVFSRLDIINREQFCIYQVNISWIGQLKPLFLLQGVCTYFSRHHALRLDTLLLACLLVVCNLLKASESKPYPCDCRSSVEFFSTSQVCAKSQPVPFSSGSRNKQGRLQPTLFSWHQTCPPESQLCI